MTVCIFFGIPFFIFVQIAENLEVGRFIGFGVSAFNFMVGLIYIAPFFVIFKMITLPPLLAGFKLNLYESDPVNSEVIQQLVYLLNVYLYYLAGYVAVLQLFAFLHPSNWMRWIGILLGWLPTITQFLVNQYAVRKIIISAKWRNLNHIQEQIKDLQSVNLKEAPETTIARINQLMDLHDRISAKPNSMLNWGTGLSFLNQLMLPLLGLLLGNIDKLLKFINP